MLAEGHELDMCIMVLLDVFYKLVRNVGIGIPAVFIIGVGMPRADVHLIDIERLIIVLAALFQPLTVGEFVLVKVGYNGRKIGAKLHCKTVGVAVLHSAQ